MTAKDVLDWWPLIAAIVGWIILAAVGWTKMTDKVNGQGGRIKKVEDACAQAGGRMDAFEKQLSEYRRDAQDSARGLARVEKGQDDLHEAVNQGNLQIGSQLHGIEKLIEQKDVRTQVRLTRIETVAKIEEKIGPLSTD